MNNTSSAKPWVIYTRVSTVEQVEEGVSLDAQEENCRAILRVYGHAYLKTITDRGISGKNLTARPGIQEVLTLASTGQIGGIIATKLDRVSRSLADLLMILQVLEKHQVGLHLLAEHISTEGASGKLMIHILGAMAQWEREVIGERVKAAAAKQKADGFFTGGNVPVGLTVEGDPGRRRLVPGEHAQAVGNLWRLVADGKSVREAAAYLTQAGVPTSTGKGWSCSTISVILRDPRRIGLVVEQGLFDEVQRVLAARRGTTTVNKGRILPGEKSDHSERTWLGAGLWRCGICGGPMHGVSARGKAKVWYPYLRCVGRGKGQCRAKDLPAKLIEGLLVDTVAQVGTQGEYLDGVRNLMLEAERSQGPLQRELAEAETLVGALRTRRDQMLEMIDDPVVRRAMKDKIAKIQLDLEAAEARFTEIQLRINGVIHSEEHAQRVGRGIATICQRLPVLPDEEKKGVLSDLVRCATVHADSGEIHFKVDMYVRTNDEPCGDPAGFVLQHSMVPGKGLEPSRL